MQTPSTNGRFELSARLIALIGVMIAIVFVATRVIQVPTGGGYIHLGDAAIYFASYIFGPVVGAIAGAAGTALVDTTSGYGSYAPGSFLIHGLQGLVAGVIAWRGGFPRMLLAAIAGGVIMVGGYFLYEYLILSIGLGVAAANIGPNVLQAVAGGVIGIPLVLAVRQAYPPIRTWSYRRTWREESR